MFGLTKEEKEFVRKLKGISHATTTSVLALVRKYNLPEAEAVHLFATTYKAELEKDMVGKIKVTAKDQAWLDSLVKK